MLPLTTSELGTIIRALRRQNEQKHRLLSVIGEDKGRDTLRANIENDIRKLDYLVDYFENARDRVFRSENFSIRIPCKL